MLSKKVGQVVEVKLLVIPPSKGLGSGLADVVEVVDVDCDIVISNVVVTEGAAVALLRSSFSAGSIVVHRPWSKTGMCVSSKSASARYGAFVGSGSSSIVVWTLYASAGEASNSTRPRAMGHCIRALWCRAVDEGAVLA